MSNNNNSSLITLTDAWENEQISLLHRWYEVLYDPTATSDQLDEIEKLMEASDKKYLDATNEIINASVC